MSASPGNRIVIVGVTGSGKSPLARQLSRRREIPQLLKQAEHAHLQVIHLRSAKETKEWLGRIKR